KLAEIHLQRRRKRHDVLDVAKHRGMGLDRVGKLRRARFNQMTVIAKERRQNLGVPATARRDLDDRHARLDAEKLQRLDRVAVAVARSVLGGTPLAVDGLLQGRGGIRLHRGSVGEAWPQQGAGKQQELSRGLDHGSSLPWWNVQRTPEVSKLNTAAEETCDPCATSSLSVFAENTASHAVAEMASRAGKVENGTGSLATVPV